MYSGLLLLLLLTLVLRIELSRGEIIVFCGFSSDIRRFGARFRALREGTIALSGVCKDSGSIRGGR